MTTMLARTVCLAVVMTVACSSPPSGAAQRASSSPSSQVYLGSLGNAGCKPAATFKGWQAPDGLPETGLDSGRGSFWALFFHQVPPPAGKEIKVVWRMTGSGPFTFLAADTDGKALATVWGPKTHGGSNWSHPGDEVGTGFSFPHGGCWNIHVARTDAAGDLWLDVAGQT
jgi:hypothetical protein